MVALSTIPTFHWSDYLVFALSICISFLIGVYFAVMDKKKKRSASSEFLLAGRNAQSIPVALSILVSFMNAIYIIGVPVEVMLNGAIFSLSAVGYMLSAAIAAHVFVPVFHKLQLTSVYQYLDDRFNATVRAIGTLVFLLMLIFFMAVVLFAPAVAFATVTGLSQWVTIFGIGIICAIYTSIGGMRTVIWTDTFQLVVMVIGVITILIKGSNEAGGMTRVMDLAREGGRLDFDSLSLDPRERHTVWNTVFGTLGLVLGLLVSNQMVIQRYLSVKKTRDAQISIYLALLVAALLCILLTFVGLTMHAYFDCNPLTQGYQPTQVVPLFMMYVLGDLPGLPGLFTASVFAAALSTVSSVIQAMAAVTIQDVIQPAYVHIRKKPIEDRYVLYMAKGLALLYGLLTVALSYIAPFLGTLILQLSFSILGTIGGPLFGLFILAVLFPCANSWGAGIGVVVSLVMSLWLNVGAILLKNPPVPLPLRTENCPFASNATTISWTMTSPALPVPTSAPTSGIKEFYKISYLWYAPISAGIAVFLGLVVSAITGFNKDISKRLVFPYSTMCCCSDATCRTSDKVTDKEILSCDEVHQNKEAPKDEVFPKDKYLYDNQGFITTRI